MYLQCHTEIHRNLFILFIFIFSKFCMQNMAEIKNIINGDKTNIAIREAGRYRIHLNAKL